MSSSYYIRALALPAFGCCILEHHIQPFIFASLLARNKGVNGKEWLDVRLAASPPHARILPGSESLQLALLIAAIN